MASEESGFLSRWARRKALAREGQTLPEQAVADPALPVVAEEPVVQATPAPSAEAEPAPPAPTLDDVALLHPGEDVSRFVVQGVDPTVKNAALKKLFADPHYNVMDGLDTYIDDYGKPDPLPLGMLRTMAQSRLVGLLDDADEEVKDKAAPQPALPPAPAEDALPSPAADEPAAGKAS